MEQEEKYESGITACEKKQGGQNITKTKKKFRLVKMYSEIYTTNWLVYNIINELFTLQSIDCGVSCPSIEPFLLI